MRRVQRLPLPPSVKGYLSVRQARVDNGASVEKAWRQARQTQTIGKKLLAVLVEMAGKRERCMFCNDSRGTDIEHFWPKERFSNKLFAWDNMLFACTGCNRKKGDRFPLDAHGHPLLVDPSVDDPWQFLDYVPATGEVTARWRADIDRFDPKGEATTDGNTLPLNIEAVTSGRQRCFRNLCRAVEECVAQARQDDAQASGMAFERFKNNILEWSDFGLSRWLFHFSDPSAEPICRLLRDYPEYWNRIREVTAIH